MQLLGENQPLLDTRAARIEADGGKALGQLLTFFPPGQRRGQGIDAVRPIRDDIKSRIEALVADLIG